MQIIARSPYHVLKSYGLSPGAASAGGAVLLERLSDGAAVAFEAEAAALCLLQFDKLADQFPQQAALGRLFLMHYREPASA